MQKSTGVKAYGGGEMCVYTFNKYGNNIKYNRLRYYTITQTQNRLINTTVPQPMSLLSSGRKKKKKERNARRVDERAFPRAGQTASAATRRAYTTQFSLFSGSIK